MSTEIKVEVSCNHPECKNTILLDESKFSIDTCRGDYDEYYDGPIVDVYVKGTGWTEKKEMTVYSTWQVRHYCPEHSK